MALAVGIFSFRVTFGDLIIAGAGLGLVLFTIIAPSQKRHEKIRTEAKIDSPTNQGGRNTPQCQRHHYRNGTMLAGHHRNQPSRFMVDTTVANNISCSRRVDSFRYHCLVSSWGKPAMESSSHYFTQTTAQR
ncbi:hypothetical protein ABMV07_03155 [Corynebacterium belfantii]|uniref:hypothetical protein n=1 Tax=Corynebacterium belfantii TaxID=2014537 RepID=UPI0035A95373